MSKTLPPLDGTTCSPCCCDCYHGSIKCHDGTRICKLCGYPIKPWKKKRTKNGS